jgi:hypothetical protein
MACRKLCGVLLYPILLSIIVPQCQAQDPVKECLATIAKGGLFKTVVEKTESHKYSSAKEWFCSQDFLAAAQSSSTAANVQTPWGSGSYNANDASQVSQRNQFCQNSTSDFDSQQKSYLTLQVGDEVVARELQTCMGGSSPSMPYLTPVVNPYPDGTFDILLSVRAYPGGNPLVVSQNILGGATVADVTELHPGATIPFQGSGPTPITGTYKFDAASPMARVKVMTSIGSVTVIARRCPTGKIGAWETDQDVQQTVQVPMPPYSDSRGVPRAGCDPHCGTGDFIPYDFIVANDIVLGSPTAHLASGGAVFDSLVLTQPHPFQLHIVVNTRSGATTLVVNATQTKVTTQTVRQRVDGGDIVAGHAFTLKLDDGTNASAVIKDSAGTVLTLSAAQMQADNGLPSWLKLSSVPQHSGNSLLTNLISTGPTSCTVPSE